MKMVRCAIYTRKSSDEGLEQSFNSLDAQREACAAYIRSPERATSTGKAIGGRAFSRGQLYLMLKCVTYTGQIGHKGAVYPGKHPAIIDPDMFAQVQAILADNTSGARTRSRASSPSLLAGKIVDQDGKPLIATHASRGATRYRYYVSHGLHHGTASTGIRLPARKIERLVIDRAGELFRGPLQLVASAWLDVAPDKVGALHDRCAELIETRSNAKLLAGLLTQVRIEEGQVVLNYDTLAIATALAASQHDDAPAEIIITLDARLTRSGRVLRLVHDSGVADERANASLTKLLVQAHGWWAELRNGEIDIKQLAAREEVTGSYVTRVLRLAFLSPALTQAILAGRQPVGLDVRSLTLTGTVAARWTDQASFAATA